MFNKLKAQPAIHVIGPIAVPACELRPYPGADWPSTDRAYIERLSISLEQDELLPSPCWVVRTEWGLEVCRHADSWLALLGSDQGATVHCVEVKASLDELALLIIRDYMASPMYNRIGLVDVFRDLLSAHGWTHAALGRSIGISETSVTNVLRFSKLRPEVKLLVRSGAIKPALAKELISLPEDQQVALAKEAYIKGWTLKRLIARIQGPQSTDELLPAESKPTKSPYLDAAIKALDRSRIGSPMTLDEDSTGRLSLTISCHSIAELAGVSETLFSSAGECSGLSASIQLGPYTREQFDTLFAALVDEF